MSGTESTLAMAERHVAKLEQRIAQQKAHIDEMARENGGSAHGKPKSPVTTKLSRWTISS